MKQQKESIEILIRDQIFTGRFEQWFLNSYRKIFFIEEIESSKILQWVFGALLFTFFVTFNGWIRRPGITIQSYLDNTYSCWPYFQGCGESYFLEALPHGYSQTILYVGLLALMVLVVYFMWKKDWVLAHMGLLVLWLWKFLVIFYFSHSFGGNYDYYDIILSFVLLFLPHKVFFLKLSFVLFYFLASTIKIHEGWILGTYFTSLKTGLPIFSDAIAPVVTNLLIFMQIIGAWFLFSKNKLLQRGTVCFFLLFHLYSGILVEYRYLTSTIPPLLILFGPMYRATAIPLDKKAIAGWSMVVMLFVFQFIPIIIKGDQKMTLEGNFYGLYMFEANHQCASSITRYNKDGTVTNKETQSISARNRCDPYKVWFNIKEACKREGGAIERVEWTQDHSINGGPFYRIVDEKNACALVYHPFQHNSWIKLPEDNPKIIGYPVKNIYY